jgi:penicillin amidase
MARSCLWDNVALVFSKRILKLINLSIAIFLILALLAAWWTLWRPLPKTSGSLPAPIARNARIDRDALGVPHITAASWQDAIFLQGFVTAQDRMWQMDAIRRVAAGELSEIIGRSTLEVDREARRMRMRRIAEEQVTHLSPGDRAVLTLYTRGVNFYLEQNRGKYGVEFELLRYDPRPWTVEDCILTGLQMFETLSSSWKDDLRKMQMLEKGDAAKVEYLLPPRIGTEPLPGSNAWAVAGSRTASGKPILASDPHLEFSLPSTWYMIHLKAPGLNVSGVSLPGLPAVIIGHNERIAWGVTNLHFDVQDLYREQFDPRTGRYLFRGQFEQARPENDVIPVKGEKPVEVTEWVTRHGPIFLNEGGNYYSLKWIAAEPGAFQFPLLDIDRAQNWQQFNDALRRYFGPAQNWVYADVDGNIGYRAAGQLPVRKGFRGDVPLDGASGQFEWDGYMPFDQLPSYFNPPSGLIATANQNPFPPGYPYTVSGGFAPPYRVRQIRALLTARAGWKPVEMLAVQKDVYSAFSAFLAQQAVAAYDRKRPADRQLADAIAVFRGWNGQMDKDSNAALLADTLFRRLRRNIAERASPKNGALYEVQMAPAVIEKLLREHPPGWFQDWDQMLLANLREAIEEGAKVQGSNVAGWRWGAYNVLDLKNPVAGRLPIIGQYFNIGPIWMSGSSTTVKQTTRRLGPSMRMIVDLSNLDGSFQNITAGESGHLLSGHYKDQWPAYYAGTSFPMQFNKTDVKATLQVVAAQ